MHWSIAFLCSVFALLTLVVFIERGLIRRYSRRVYISKVWRRRFPDASDKEIREFLNGFVTKIGFTDGQPLCFAPDDRVKDVLRAFSLIRSSADSLKLKEFVTGLQNRFRVEPLDSWTEDSTLGDLFLQTRSHGRRSGFGMNAKPA